MSGTYEYEEDSMGNVTLTMNPPAELLDWYKDHNPEYSDDDYEEDFTRYLQSEDNVTTFLKDVKEIESIWTRRYGSGYRRKPYNGYTSMESMISDLIAPYFEG